MGTAGTHRFTEKVVSQQVKHSNNYACVCGCTVSMQACYKMSECLQVPT